MDKKEHDCGCITGIDGKNVCFLKECKKHKNNSEKIYIALQHTSSGKQNDEYNPNHFVEDDVLDRKRCEDNDNKRKD